MPSSSLLAASGYGGNFVLTIKAGEKVEKLECAAVVVATGGGWTELKGPLAKACRSSMPLYALNEQFQGGAALKGPVVIVDTPDPSGKGLMVQDFAWDETLALAADIKRKQPLEQVFVIFQEMRAFGLSELAYKEAADLGVRFVRYDRSGGPKIDPKEPTKLTVKDLAQGEVISIPFGTLAFAAIPANKDNMGIADALRIPMSPEGGVRRGSIQRGPVSTPRPGVFVCGSAMFPKGADAAKAEGEAAGILAGEFAMRGVIEYGGIVAVVDQEKCSACLTCVRTCPFDAPFIGAAGKAEIRVQACQGCGMCAGICPSKAIELRGFTDDQVAQETRAMLGGDF
ncbi:MAG: 4Fe-4S binding protein [Thermoplasmata archaeon]